MSEYAQPVVKWLIAWLVALAVLAGFHFAVVTRAEDALAACRNQVTTKVERYNLLRNAKSAHEQESRKERQENLTQQYADLVFDSDGLNKLDFEIRSMAEENNLSDFSSRRVGTTSAIGTLKFTRVGQRDLVLSFAGSFPDILRFVNVLERHYPAVFVDQFTLKAAAGKTPGLSCTLECSLLYEVATQ